MAMIGQDHHPFLADPSTSSLRMITGASLRDGQSDLNDYYGIGHSIFMLAFEQLCPFECRVQGLNA